jgi:molybdenum cofactor biosynthesis protein MoaC
MVNVSLKNESHRIAKAQGEVIFSNSEYFKLLESSSNKKGDVLTVAKLAGIQAAKQTGTLIPLAHPIPLTNVSINLSLNSNLNKVEIIATVECVGRTGVEVEAMVAVSLTACTIFDMCKSVDKAISIGNINVLHKSGGKQGTWNRTENEKYTD